MRIFVTATFGGSREEIDELCSAVRSAGLEDFCFVRDAEEYKGTFTDAKEMMVRAKKEIQKSDALLIDMTEKPTGRAIEAGIAYALGKKIIVIIKKGVLLKNAVTGIADLVIEYDGIKDIIPEIESFMNG